MIYRETGGEKDQCNARNYGQHGDVDRLPALATLSWCLGLAWAEITGMGVVCGRGLAGRERCFTLLSQPVTASNDFILTLCYQQQVRIISVISGNDG